MMDNEDKPRMDSCGLYSKYTIFALEFLLFALGASVFGGAIWVLISEDIWVSMMDRSHLRNAAIILVCATVVTVFVSVIAMWGTLVESRGAIIFSIFGSVVLMALMLTTGILGILSKSHYPDVLYVKMQDSIREYYGVNLQDSYHRQVTDTWDRMQTREECCAVADESWYIYRNSRWYDAQSIGTVYGDRYLVPETCCLRDQYGNYRDLFKCQTWTSGPPSQAGYANNDALIYRGCFEEVKELLRKKADFLIGVGFGSAIYMIIIIVLLGFLACRLPSSFSW